MGFSLKRKTKEEKAAEKAEKENISRERLMERLVPVVDGQLRQRFWAGKDGNRLVENFIVKSACHFMLDCVAMKKGPEEEEVLAAMENIRAMLQHPTGNILVLPTTKSTMTA